MILLLMIKRFKKKQEYILLKNKAVNIRFNTRKSDGHTGKQPYNKGDNDFYWLNCPDKEHFFIIPEDLKLIINKPYLCVVLTSKNWYNKHLLKYFNVTKDTTQ